MCETMVPTKETTLRHVTEARNLHISSSGILECQSAYTLYDAVSKGNAQRASTTAAVAHTGRQQSKYTLLRFRGG